MTGRRWAFVEAVLTAICLLSIHHQAQAVTEETLIRSYPLHVCHKSVADHSFSAFKSYASAQSHTGSLQIPENNDSIFNLIFFFFELKVYSCLIIPV